MMKSLAILAATLAAATQARQLSVSNSTQEGGKGDRRLAEEDNPMFNKNEGEDCTEENPEDCGRHLQAQQLSSYEFG